VAVLLIGLALPAQADCPLCDDLIELDAAGAVCMAQALSQTTFPGDGSPVLIDLAPCMGRAGGAERGGLVTMPSYTDILKKTQPQQAVIPPAGALKTAYMLNADWGRCTDGLLRGRPVASGSVLTLDLLNQCP